MERKSNETSRATSDAPPKRSSVCSQTGEPFQPGDKVYSILYEESGEIRRLDLSAAAMRTTPLPEKIVARWTSRAKSESDRARRERLAPNDALVAYFDALADKPEKAALRYALALLLARRRVFRLELDERDSNRDVICAYYPRTETMKVAAVVPMTREKIAEVQAQLVEALDSPIAALEKEGGSFGDVETVDEFEQGEEFDVERAAAEAARMFESE